MNFGQELLGLAKFTCETVAIPLFIQIVICLIQGTISFYAVFSILIRFTSITTKLLAASIGMLFSVSVFIFKKFFNSIKKRYTFDFPQFIYFGLRLYYTSYDSQQLTFSLSKTANW